MCCWNTVFCLTEHAAHFPEMHCLLCPQKIGTNWWVNFKLSAPTKIQDAIAPFLWWRQEWGSRLSDCSQIDSTINWKLQRGGDQGGHRLGKTVIWKWTSGSLSNSLGPDDEHRTASEFYSPNTLWDNFVNTFVWGKT